MERRDEPDDGGLPGARGADQCGHGAGSGAEGHLVEHLLASLVGEAHPVERHVAAERGNRHGPPRIRLLRPLPEHLARPLQPRERLGQLRADAHHLEDRRHQERQECRERHKPAQGQRAGEDLPGADIHHHRPHRPHEQGARQVHARDDGQRLEHIVQQALHPARKDCGLPRFRVIPLDHPHAAEGFGQAPRDLRSDLAARPEDRPDGAERPAQDEAERQDEGQGQAGQQRADAKQDPEREDRGQQAPEELHQPSPEEIPHALDVGHNAGDQGPALVRVVVGDGQAADVGLHGPAQLRDEPLGGLGEHLGQREGRRSLHRGGEDHRQHQRPEQVVPLVTDDVVDQELGGGRQDQPRETIGDHQYEADCQQVAAGTDQLRDQWPERP